MSKTRRKLLLDVVVISSATLLGACTETPKLTALGENDVTAKAYAYRVNSPQPNQQCANCRLKLDIQDPNYLACSLFPGRKVVIGGWCSAWDANS
jgi:High potential iron-sulfur protein